jgi:HEPN domain-containing protein
MCQQAIEKLAKGLFGLYFDFNSIPFTPPIPFTHNIEKLINPIADKVSVHIPLETCDFFVDLSQDAVNKRYPDYKLLMSQKATRAEALRMFNLTKEAFTWLQTLKPPEPRPEDTPLRPRP